VSGVVGLSFEERFWSKVRPAPADECWMWTASLNTGGYGQFAYRGRPLRAHRVAYELLICDIPAGLQLDHLCRVRPCVNPWHLEPVTNDVNMARGELRSYVHPVKTHCKHGHELSGDNVRRDPDGHRRCRTCERRDSLAGYYRRKARAGGAA
jgi:hypothetical protein